MHRLIRIVFLFIALIYLGGMTYQVGYFAYFKMNQAKIAAEHCVNKDKPEMHCNGQCHLEKELEKAQVFSDDDQNQEEKSQLPEVELAFLIAIFPEMESKSVSSEAKLFELAWKPEAALCLSDLDRFWHPPKSLMNS